MHIHLFSCHVILQLLLENKVNTKGVIRPLEPEIYIPGECNVDHGFHGVPLVQIPGRATVLTRVFACLKHWRCWSRQASSWLREWRFENFVYRRIDIVYGIAGYISSVNTLLYIHGPLCDLYI